VSLCTHSFSSTRTQEPKEKTEEATGEATDTADAAASAKTEGDVTENGVEVAEEQAAVRKFQMLACYPNLLRNFSNVGLLPK